MKKLVTVFTMVALMMMSSLTVQAKGTNSTEDIGTAERIDKMLEQLEVQKAGKAYPGELYISAGYVIRMEEYEDFKKEIRGALEKYNSCHELKLEVDIRIFSEDYAAVDFYSENLYYIENTPIYIGKACYVREGEWNYWESSEGFGSGKSGTVEGGDAVIVTRVSYLDEDGNIISTSFDDSEEIRFADLRMLHICSIEGDDLGWIWPLSLVDPL